jgi:hypothetical protein
LEDEDTDCEEEHKKIEKEPKIVLEKEIYESEEVDY